MQGSTNPRSLCITASLCALVACGEATHTPHEEAAESAEQVAPLPSAGVPGVRIRESQQAALTCYRIDVTGDVRGPGVKYTAGHGSSHLVAFRFQAPWRGKQFVSSFRPLVDNAALLHRGALYVQPNGLPDTVVPHASGVHSGAELLFAWTHDTDVLELAADEGIAVPGGAVLELEHQYGLLAEGSSQDASGVEVCVSPVVPRRQVAMAKLGALDRFEGDQVTEHCVPTYPADIEIQPLLGFTRGRGRSVTLVRHRADGSSDTVFEAAPNEVTRGASLTLKPDEWLSVTCSYDGRVKSGKEPYLEACELLALHAPPGALYSDNVAPLIQGVNTCMFDDPPTPRRANP